MPIDLRSDLPGLRFARWCNVISIAAGFALLALIVADLADLFEVMPMDLARWLLCLLALSRCAAMLGYARAGLVVPVLSRHMRRPIEVKRSPKLAVFIFLVEFTLLASVAWFLARALVFAQG